MTDRLNEIRERAEEATRLKLRYDHLIANADDLRFLLAEVDRLERELLISEWAVDILNEQNGYKNLRPNDSRSAKDKGVKKE